MPERSTDRIPQVFRGAASRRTFSPARQSHAVAIHAPVLAEKAAADPSGDSRTVEAPLSRDELFELADSDEVESRLITHFRKSMATGARPFRA